MGKIRLHATGVYIGCDMGPRFRGQILHRQPWLLLASSSVMTVGIGGINARTECVGYEKAGIFDWGYAD